MRPLLRTTTDVAAGVALVLAILLGGWWARDRLRHWERPQWRSESFELLRAMPGDGPRGQGLWVVAANPRCATCLGTIWRLYEARARHARPEELVALIVDTPVRPGPRALRRLPPIPVWWDRENRWRRRWGHRVYGELLQFDGSGRYLRTITAGQAPRTSDTRPPGVSTAPALEGGT